jgi:hypothetical protein
MSAGRAEFLVKSVLVEVDEHLRRASLNGDGRHDGSSGAIATCWHRRADELPDWVWNRLVNRTDFFGRYYRGERNGCQRILCV